MARQRLWQACRNVQFSADHRGGSVVGLRFGYHDVPVSELGADVLIDHWDELIPALEGLAS